MNLSKALLDATLAEGSAISGAFSTDKDLPLNQALVVNSLMRWKTSPLPTGYTLLNYLESGGTQWVNTGLYVNNGTPFKITFEIVTTTNPSTSFSRGFFGARANTTGYGFGYFGYNNVNYIAIRDGSNSLEFATPYDDGRWYGHKTTFEVKANGDVYINGEFIRNVVFTTGTASSLSRVFNWNYTSASTGAVVKIYEFETAGCHMYPAMRDADSVVGMYDIVQNIFRTNQGSGTFTYG